MLRRATYACSCTETSVYCCDRHFPEHARAPGKHTSEYLIIKLTQDQQSGLFSKLIQISKHLQVLEQKLLESAKEIINCIQSKTSETLRSIQDINQSINDLIKGKGISKSNYQVVNSFDFENSIPVIRKVEKIKHIIKSLFGLSLKKWKECDEAFYSNGELFSLDLDTLKISRLVFSPAITIHAQTCKIDKNTYFFSKWS